MTWEDFKGLAGDKLADLTFSAADAFGGREIAKINDDTNKATITGNNGENTPVGQGIGAPLNGVPQIVWIVGGVLLLGGVVYLAAKK